MESATAATAAVPNQTDAKTIADLLPVAIADHSNVEAVRYKDDSGTWTSKTYAEVGEIVRDLSRGLIELGVEKGDKVAILSNTRVEWTYFDFAALTAGATVVPIYQTNSPEECQYVLENSDAKVVIVEDDEQMAKVREVRERCPMLEQVIRISGDSSDAMNMLALAERGQECAVETWEERWRSIGPDDICTFIYTSGTTGPPKGCVISHGNYRSMCDMALAQSVLDEGEITYLFLPLAHSFALLIQFLSFAVGGTLAYWERDPLKILPNLSEVKPHLLPVGAADLREDLHRRDLGGREGGRDQEDDLRPRDRDRQEGAGARARRQAARARCSRPSTSSPTSRCCRRSGRCSAAT